MSSKEFGNRLAQLRTTKNISAREMSLSLGLSPSYISNIENDEILPSMRTFLNICDYLNITPKDFFDTDIKDPELLIDLYETSKGLTTDRLEAIISVLKFLQK